MTPAIVRPIRFDLVHLEFALVWKERKDVTVLGNLNVYCIGTQRERRVNRLWDIMVSAAEMTKKGGC